ncbi:DUF5316 family protein [Paenibacillus alvei]|uniref:DUF5316 domain-containing protein n=1 Tax=Paenibacillus alvei TaxID=44250 RepID=A0AAP7DHZ4_PAEAL|nr:DUF5316 family protein [Paenibacillus alvei]NOJ70104.1 DUF5316 domain-containing protein [Paenibacillus alvei]
MIARRLAIGLIFVILTVLYTSIWQGGDAHILFNINCYFGLGLWAVGSLFTGTFNDNTKLRFNMGHIPDEDHRRNFKFSGTMFVTGLPSIVTCIFIYVVVL